jgi:hypothetical protein
MMQWMLLCLAWPQDRERYGKNARICDDRSEVSAPVIRGSNVIQYEYKFSYESAVHNDTDVADL